MFLYDFVSFTPTLEMRRKYGELYREFRPKWLELMKELNVSLEPEFLGGYYVPIPREKCIYLELCRRYSGNDRHYHNLTHILDCLNGFECVKHLAKNPVQVKAGLVWHDIVYNTHRNDNEEKSTEKMKRDLLYLRVSLEFIQGASKTLLATKHDKAPQTIDEKLIIDIDLSILGKPKDVFENYNKNIRKEYSWVSEEDFRNARSKVLKSFLDQSKRPSIYYTPFFRDKYEKQAKENLERAIGELESISYSEFCE